MPRSTARPAQFSFFYLFVIHTPFFLVALFCQLGFHPCAFCVRVFHLCSSQSWPVCAPSKKFFFRRRRSSLTRTVLAARAPPSGGVVKICFQKTILLIFLYGSKKNSFLRSGFKRLAFLSPKPIAEYTKDPYILSATFFAMLISFKVISKLFWTLLVSCSQL